LILDLSALLLAGFEPVIFHLGGDPGVALPVELEGIVDPGAPVRYP
jgi:hypothetical protein